MTAAEKHPPSARSRTRHEWFLFVFLLLWLAFIQFEQWPVLVNNGFDNRDCAIYTYCGHLITQGEVVYKDFWDQKPPVIYFLNALALTLSGGGLWGPWVLALLTLWLSLFLAYKALKLWAGSRAAMIGMVVFSASLPGVYAGGNITESYALPLQWALVWLVLLWRDQGKPGDLLFGLLLGVFGALCMMLRQNLIDTPVAVAITVYVTLILEQRWLPLLKVIAGKALGVSAVLLSILGYLAANDALTEFWEAAFVYNFGFKTSGPLLQKLFGHLPMFDYVPAIGLTFLGYGLLLYTELKRGGYRREQFQKREANSALRVPFRRLLLVIWLPVALGFATVSGQAFNHYYMTLLPVVTILVAVVTVRLLETGMGLSPAWRKVWIGLAIAVVLLTVVKHHRKIVRNLHNDRVRQIEATAALIQEATDPGDAVFVWGVMADVYLKSERPHASRYTIIYPLLAPGYAGPEQVSELIEDLNRSKPPLIIATSPSNKSIPPLGAWNPQAQTWNGTIPAALEPWYDYVEREYEKAGTVGEWGWIVYRRRSAE